MKAILGEALDSIDDYGLTEVAAPAPGPGEVQVRIAACGIGYVDVLVALGGYQVKPALPHIPGMEAAGTVAALGEGVTGLAVGDRVLAAVQSTICAAAARSLMTAITPIQRP